MRRYIYPPCHTFLVQNWDTILFYKIHVLIISFTLYIDQERRDKMGVKVKFGTVQKIRKNDISPGKIIYIHHHWVTHHHGVLHHHWVETTTHLGHSAAHHHATSATHAS